MQNLSGVVRNWTEKLSPVGLSDRYVTRLLRLAWLAPGVLERLVVHREPRTISIYDLCFVTSLSWDEQRGRVVRLTIRQRSWSRARGYCPLELGKLRYRLIYMSVLFVAAKCTVIRNG